MTANSKPTDVSPGGNAIRKISKERRQACGKNLTIPGCAYQAGTIWRTIRQIAELMEEGEYFTINRPRQFGKTTILSRLEKQLNQRDDYLALKISFEGIDRGTYQHQESFIHVFLNMFIREFEFLKAPELAQFTEQQMDRITHMPALSRFITSTEEGLDVRLILERFQAFMREHYSGKDRRFLEREGRLLFLSFLRPILSGRAFDFKEPNVSEERRMDIVITCRSQRYVLELKIWHGPRYHQKGLEQLSDYLDTYSLREGYLLIYDFNKIHYSLFIIHYSFYTT